MKFAATIQIMPRPEILDPQGKATRLGMHNLGFDQIDEVRIGKLITLNLEAESEEKAKEIVEESCKKLLANTVIEEYSFSLRQLEEA
ncbi:MAG: phosphoribosylformylglycinamidine synthase subunit PurS [Bacteroidia bacterium]|nr:phosphoribosylformylglycinamidine synthase subunit PurS [Bacteroidia bacterium]